MNSKTIRENEEIRVEALGNQDALTYYKKCELLGTDPEDEALYQKGALDHQLEQEKLSEQQSDLEEIANKTTIKSNEIDQDKKAYELKFLREVGNLLNTNWNEYGDSKIKVMTEYFPKRFGDGGSHDLKKYDTPQISRMLYSLVQKLNQKYQN